MIDIEKLTFNVKAPEDLGRSAQITVSIDLTDGVNPSELLSYIRSGGFKQDFDRHWLSKQGGGYGMSFVGGPTPVFSKSGSDGNPDRSSQVLGYQQVISVNKWD